MPVPTARTAGVAVGEGAGSSRGPSDDDRLRDNSGAVSRRTCVDHVRHWNGRRRFVDPTACEADYLAAVEEFQQAMEKYKRWSGRMFPTWSEVLELLQSLGYEKVAGELVTQVARCKDRGGPGSPTHL
jgi:hypothetical protein